MIIAILEDLKGFRLAKEMPKFKPKIIIPIRAAKTIQENLTVKAPYKQLEFQFYKWLEEKKVALYIEKGE